MVVDSPTKRKFSQTSKKSTKSISQEYLLRTGKKYDGDRELAGMSQSIMSNGLPIGNATQRNSTGRMRGHHAVLSRDDHGLNGPHHSNQKDPFLHHVLKQINSLKVENLELKKMINDRVVSQQRSRS